VVFRESRVVDEVWHVDDGLWSKADSHVYFDDFTVTPAD
jgi:hypothetical protein